MSESIHEPNSMEEERKKPCALTPEADQAASKSEELHPKATNVIPAKFSGSSRYLERETRLGVINCSIRSFIKKNNNNNKGTYV